MQTEVVVSEYILPKIRLKNKEELKDNITIALQKYDKILTEETVDEGRKYRAELNKLAALVDSRRKEVKEHLERPYKEFKADVEEVTSIIKEKSKFLDVQIKEFEKQEKIKKHNDIVKIYDNMPRKNIHLKLEDVFDTDRWYLKGTSLNKITKELEYYNDKYDYEIGKIEELNSKYETVLIDMYTRMRPKNLDKVMLEEIRLRKQANFKTNVEPKKIEQKITKVNDETKEEEKQQLKLEILVTKEQLIKLNDCFIENQILWRKI